MKQRKSSKVFLTCLVALLLFVLPAACAAPATSGDSSSEFVFGEDGYAFGPTPYGSTREEVEAAIGSEMVDLGTNPRTEPFEYSSYTTSQATVKLAGLTSRVDAQFTEEDGLFAITYNSSVTPEQREDFLTTYRDHYTELFGEPTEDSTNDNGLTMLTWEDTESGTVFTIQVEGPTAAGDSEARAYNVALGVLEKWRYTEAASNE